VRKIAASYIIPGNQAPLKNGILICDDNGTITGLVDTGGKLKEQAGLEFYNGILVPGFVNTHCHLELSSLKGKIPEKILLNEFLQYINRLRNSQNTEPITAMKNADMEMQFSGVVAVGDISNSSSSLEIKQNSNLFYHTFTEAFGFLPSRAEKAYSIAETVNEQFLRAGLSSTITPHSPYSVSENLFLKIAEKALRENSLLSVHCLESEAESAFFKSGEGPICDHLKNNLLLDVSHWNPLLKNPVEYILQFLPSENQLLLVHNTYITQQDIDVIKKKRKLSNTYMVLCPNSNLYIEDQLPPVHLLREEGMNICIGTDSLASNHKLSVFEELKTLQKYFPEITIQELIEWGCLNGARALQAEHRFGSFEPGKKPGINLIIGADLHQLRLTPGSRIKVLQ
jgi:aminodeoxyfutalosine deaminase